MAESIYIDFNLYSFPSSSFSAAGDEPGVWNSIDGSSKHKSLLDTHGVPSEAEITVDYAPGGAGNYYPDPNTSGDIENLLDDGLGRAFGGVTAITVEALPLGNYEVVTYARHPNPGVVDVVITEVLVTGYGTQRVEGRATWDFTASGVGNTYSRHAVSIVDDEPLVILVAGATDSWNGNGHVNGLQIISIPEPAGGSLLAGLCFLICCRRVPLLVYRPQLIENRLPS